MEVDRKKAADCPRRPMRIIRKSDIEVGNDAPDDENDTKKKETLVIFCDFESNFGNL